MKEKSLIKKDIKQKNNKSPVCAYCPPILGKKLYDINIASRKYVRANTIVMSILSILLILTLVQFIVTFNNWLVITISFITILCCIIWATLAVKRSLLKIEYVIYENYIVQSYEDWSAYGDMKKFKGYKIKTTLLDKLFKPKTQTLIIYFNDKYLPYLKLSCINDDMNKIVDTLINKTKK